MGEDSKNVQNSPQWYYFLLINSPLPTAQKAHQHSDGMGNCQFFHLFLLIIAPLLFNKWLLLQQICMKLKPK